MKSARLPISLLLVAAALTGCSRDRDPAGTLRTTTALPKPSERLRPVFGPLDRLDEYSYRGHSGRYRIFTNRDARGDWPEVHPGGSPEEAFAVRIDLGLTSEGHVLFVALLDPATGAIQYRRTWRGRWYRDAEEHQLWLFPAGAHDPEFPGGIDHTEALGGLDFRESGGRISAVVFQFRENFREPGDPLRFDLSRTRSLRLGGVRALLPLLHASRNIGE